MKYKYVFYVLFMVLPAGVLFAESIQTARIDKDARWVIHADYDVFNKTSLAAAVRQKIAQRKMEPDIAQFKQKYSFHPMDEVYSVLLYGTDATPENTVVVINAKFDPPTLIGLVKDSTQTPHGTHTIYNWMSKNPKTAGKQEYGAIWNSKLIVLAGSMPATQKALDVLDGKSPNASKDSLFSDIALQPGQFLHIQADKVGQISQKEPQAMILSQTSHVLITLAETNGILDMQMDLMVPAADKLTEIEQVVRGLLAVGMLSAQQNKPQLLPILAAMKIEKNQGFLSMAFSYNSNQLLDLLNQSADENLKIELDTQDAKTADKQPESSQPANGSPADQKKS